MEIDTGTASIIGACLLLAGTIVTAAVANRRGKQEAANQQQINQAQAEQAAFSSNLELTQYIRDQVKAETQELRTELDDVKRVVASLYGLLARTREAIRDYIRRVRAQWGISADPPPIDGHLAELLGDELDVNDTWTKAKIADMVEQARTPPPKH